MGAGSIPHHLSPNPTGPYLKLQPGGGLHAHPIGIGASQALCTEGAVASWPLTNEVHQILVGEGGERRGGRHLEWRPLSTSCPNSKKS